MDMLINDEELEAICGLPHIQQLAYLRGIRPYMDVQTGIVGVKRRVSHQSIAEQLYIEPRPGIKSQSFSRDQVRRALSGLARTGLITVQSEGMQLILKCLLASRYYSVQNKAAINPPQKATTNPHDENPGNTGLCENAAIKADMAESPKAAIPQKEEIYIYLLSQFEKFWLAYPDKRSRQRAWAAFQQLNPSESLVNSMLNALQQQKQYRESQKAQGLWIPPWKYPANWLAQRCWEDELTMEVIKEKPNATHGQNSGKQSDGDMFCPPEFEYEPEERESNVIAFSQPR